MYNAAIKINGALQGKPPQGFSSAQNFRLIKPNLTESNLAEFNLA